jgi:hypothetical protein
MMKARYLVAIIGSAIALAGCQTASRSFNPEPESVVLAGQMHPDIKAAFDQDYIKLIVKGTSASAIDQSCRNVMRVRPAYRTSLALVLRTNDIEFGPGSSRKEVAEKIRSHRKDRDCEGIASRLNEGGYDNIFLEKVR